MAGPLGLGRSCGDGAKAYLIRRLVRRRNIQTRWERNERSLGGGSAREGGRIVVEGRDGGIADGTRNASTTVRRRKNLSQLAVGNWTLDIGSGSSKVLQLRTSLLRCSLQGPFVALTSANAFRTRHHSDSARLGWETVVYITP